MRDGFIEAIEDYQRARWNPPIVEPLYGGFMYELGRDERIAAEKAASGEGERSQPQTTSYVSSGRRTTGTRIGFLLFYSMVTLPAILVFGPMLFGSSHTTKATTKAHARHKANGTAPNKNAAEAEASTRKEAHPKARASPKLAIPSDAEFAKNS